MKRAATTRRDAPAPPPPKRCCLGASLQDLEADILQTLQSDGESAATERLGMLGVQMLDAVEKGGETVEADVLLLVALRLDLTTPGLRCLAKHLDSTRPKAPATPLPPTLSPTEPPRRGLPPPPALTDPPRGGLGDTPVVVRSRVVGSWPAKTHWSWEWLEGRAGHRIVPVESGAHMREAALELVTLGDLLRRAVLPPRDAAAEAWYMAQHHLLRQLPGLETDVPRPECVPPEADVQVFLGPGGTVTPFHTDPVRNILCQVRGSKYVRLHGGRGVREGDVEAVESKR
eukprot:Hpha_TRINITY_DN15332_c2_g11::TRINITY_DN15332_c2_g11_i1::g.92393::m.92393/K10277/KDM8, JMJD5; lysine-specific demethylase 8